MLNLYWYYNMWTQENISETAKEQEAEECMRKETKPIKFPALSQF